METALKDRIIDAVIEEFNQKGIKFTMDDIAHHAGISKRTLYCVVKDKEALFFETVEEVFQGIKEEERKIIEDESLDSMEKLKRILIALPNRYRTIDFPRLYDLKNTYPHIYNKIEEHLETDWENTFQIMEQAMVEGRIRRISLPMFQAMYTGFIEHYLSRSILTDSPIPYGEALEQLLDILMNGISSVQLA